MISTHYIIFIRPSISVASIRTALAHRQKPLLYTTCLIKIQSCFTYIVLLTPACIYVSGHLMPVIFCLILSISRPYTFLMWIVITILFNNRTGENILQIMFEDRSYWNSETLEIIIFTDRPVNTELLDTCIKKKKNKQTTKLLTNPIAIVCQCVCNYR